MDMHEYDDDEVARLYEDAENLRAVGPAVRRQTSGRLGSHIPVRFAAAVIAKVKILAAEDGLTVSSWIRRLVEREIARRLPAVTSTATQSSVEWTAPVVVERSINSSWQPDKIPA